VRWTGGRSNAATRRTRACQRTLPRHVKGRLRPGLDGALSAQAAWSVKQSARGPYHQAVGTSIRAAQRGARQSVDANVDKTPHCTSGDTMTPRCGCTGGSTEARRNRCVDGLVTGNSSVMTHDVGAREDWGKKAPDRRTQAGSD
jgi:hypothetical protein